MVLLPSVSLSTNLIVAEPPSSFIVTVLLSVSIFTSGGSSSSTMVTTCVFCTPSDTSVTGVVRVIVKVWSSSSIASPAIGISKVAVRLPTGMVTSVEFSV